MSKPPSAVPGSGPRAVGDAASKTNDLTAAATTDAAADDAVMAFGETEAAPALTASGTPVANAPTVQVIVNGGHKTSEDLAAEADALIGSVLNERFKLLKRIGHGGMGVVYKARHIHLDTLVAIKVLLHAQRKEDQERFVQEARLASKVLHPNTVYISDFGVLPDGRSYLAMELIQGKTLMSEINHGAMDVLRALRITMQIARGLQAVHDKGIIHRDMKPENVFLLDQDGAHDFVKIVDFGIAKATAKVSLVEEASGQLSIAAIEKAAEAEALATTGATSKTSAVPARGSTETMAGTTLGTPPYMSPEQIQALPVDGRTDQYSLGCMFYELLTGTLPFSARSPVALMMKHLNMPPPPLRQNYPHLKIPASVEALVMKMLAKDPAERFASMRELEQKLQLEIELLQIERGERTVVPTGVANTLKGRIQGTSLLIGGRRLPLWALLPVAVLLLGAGSLLGIRLLRNSGPPQRQQLTINELAALRLRALTVLHDTTKATSAGTESKRAALAALGQTRDASEKGVLEAALQDPDPEVASRAAEALGSLGDRSSVGKLQEAMTTGAQPTLRVAAAGALLQLGEESARGQLEQFLRDTNPDVQFRAATILAELGHKEALEQLRALMKRPGMPEPLRITVLHSLARGGDEESAATLRHMMQPPGPIALRAVAASKLVPLGDASSRNMLQELARKPGPEQLLSARLLASPEETELQALFRSTLADLQQQGPAQVLSAEGLGESGDSLDAKLLGDRLQPTAMDALRLAAAVAVVQIAARDPSTLAAQSLAWARGAATDRNWLLRQSAAAALGETQSSESLPLLAKLLTDERPEVRKEAISALGSRAEPSALTLLATALGDADISVRRAALQAIARQALLQLRNGTLNKSQLGELLAKTLTGGSVEEQLLAAGVLLRSGDLGQLERIQAALANSDASLRLLAVEQLTTQKELLAKALEDADEAVRFTAARKLAELKDLRALAVLDAALKRGGHDGLLAFALLSQLGQKRPPPADLQQVLKTAPTAERIKLIAALAHLPAELALPLLLRATQDPEVGVRHAVAQSASELLDAQGKPAGGLVLRRLLQDANAGVRAQAAGLLAKLTRMQGATANSEPSTTDEPAPAKSAAASPKSDGGIADASAGADADAENAQEPPPENGAATGKLVIESPPGVLFQLDKRPLQTATKVPLTLPVGAHRITALSGVQDVTIKENATVTIVITASQAEQLFRNARDAILRKDFKQALRQLQKATSLCEKNKNIKVACESLVVEGNLMLGQLFEEENNEPEAMTHYQRVLAASKNRNHAAARATAQAGANRLRPLVGEVITTKLIKKKCEETSMWVSPKSTNMLSIGNELKEVKVQAGKTLRMDSCTK